MNSKQLLFGLVAVAVVALGLAAYFVFGSGSAASDITADLPKFTVSLSPADHILGSPNAPVQLVEYAAPTCPICAHWDMTVFPGVKSAYIDTGKVAYVFRVFPLQSVDIAVEAMARCLPKSGYFQFVDMMYRNQIKWDPDGFQIPDQHAALVGMGKMAGLSGAQVDACISSQPELQKIASIGQYAEKTYNINSTPSFIIDGVFHQRDMMTIEDVRGALDAELKRKG
ncbi:MAG TPA: thioredoxin domain-containing protein [Rhizomicrobium sp.]